MVRGIKWDDRSDTILVKMIFKQHPNLSLDVDKVCTEWPGGEPPTKSAIQHRIRGFKKDAGAISPNGEITMHNKTGKGRKRSEAAFDDPPATPTTKIVNDIVQLPPTPESLAKTTLSQDTQGGAAEGIGSLLEERVLKKGKKGTDYAVTIKQEPDLDENGHKGQTLPRPSAYRIPGLDGSYDSPDDEGDDLAAEALLSLTPARREYDSIPHVMATKPAPTLPPTETPSKDHTKNLKFNPNLSADGKTVAAFKTKKTQDPTESPQGRSLGKFIIDMANEHFERLANGQTLVQRATRDASPPIPLSEWEARQRKRKRQTTITESFSASSDTVSAETAVEGDEDAGEDFNDVSTLGTQSDGDDTSDNEHHSKRRTMLKRAVKSPAKAFDEPADANDGDDEAAVLGGDDSDDGDWDSVKESRMVRSKANSKRGWRERVKRVKRGRKY